MEVDFQSFRSLHSLLEGDTTGAGTTEPQENGAGELLRRDEASRAGPWAPKTLANAILIVGIVGWDVLGEQGDFDADSPEAHEALEALASYQELLDQAAHDSEARSAARSGADRRSQSFWAVLPEGGPLDRYGWDEQNFPHLDKIAAGKLKPSRKQDLGRTRTTDQQIIGALASVILRVDDFSPYKNAPNLDVLAGDIESWGKHRGIKSGLGAKTVRARLEAALKVVAARS